jgi:hypothetical protein
LDRESARPKAATYTQNNRNTQKNAHTDINATIPGFERAKTVRALDRTATVIGQDTHNHPNYTKKKKKLCGL